MQLDILNPSARVSTVKERNQKPSTRQESVKLKQSSGSYSLATRGSDNKIQRIGDGDESRIPNLLSVQTDWNVLEYCAHLSRKQGWSKRDGKNKKHRFAFLNVFQAHSWERKRTITAFHPLTFASWTWSSSVVRSIGGASVLSLLLLPPNNWLIPPAGSIFKINC